MEVVGPAAVTFHWPLLVFDHHRTAVIQNPVAQVHLRRELAALVEVFVDGVASGEEHTADLHLVPHLEGPDFVGSEWRGKLDHTLARLSVLAVGSGQFSRATG